MKYPPRFNNTLKNNNFGKKENYETTTASRLDSSTANLHLFLPNKHKTVAQITKSSSDKLCHGNWFTYSTNCYKVFRNSTYVERLQASNICQEHDSSLSSILSIEEHSFISNLMTVKSPDKKVWIGGKKFHDQWIWDEGSNFVYTNWYRNEPTSGENCMYLHHGKNYAWQDASCGIEGKRWAVSAFLCKTPKD